MYTKTSFETEATELDFSTTAAQITSCYTAYN